MNAIFLVILILGCLVCSILQYASDFKGKYYLILIAVLSVLLIINSNPDIIPDLREYLSNFNYINIKSNVLDVKPSYYGFEKGFMFISIVLKRIWNNETFYLCAIFLINYICIYKAGKLLFCTNECSFYSILFISLWLGYFGILYGMAVLRSGLAISMSFYGLILLYNRLYFKSLILLTLAFFTQTSSIILIVGGVITYIFIHIKNNKTYGIWLFCCVALWLSRISIYLLPLIGKFTVLLSKFIPRFFTYNLYYNKTYGNGFFSKKNMLFLFLAFLYVYFRPEDDKQYDSELNIFLVGLTVAYLTNEISIGYRISDMFFVFSIPLSYKILIGNKKLTGKSRLMMMIPIIVIPFIVAFRITGVDF